MPISYSQSVHPREDPVRQRHVSVACIEQQHGPEGKLLHDGFVFEKVVRKRTYDDAKAGTYYYAAARFQVDGRAEGGVSPLPSSRADYDPEPFIPATCIILPLID